LAAAHNYKSISIKHITFSVVGTSNLNAVIQVTNQNN